MCRNEQIDAAYHRLKIPNIPFKIFNDTQYEIHSDGSGEIPAASAVAQMQQTEAAGFVSLIACATLACRRFYDNKTVKKTLSIPSWLNDMAERDRINFSGVLQEALKQKLQVN